MTENDRNTRTLIVCFVMAMMALIPLRMVEFSQTINQVKVLGETEEVYEIGEVDEMEEVYEVQEFEIDEEAIAGGEELILEDVEEVVLPNADLE